MNATIDIDNKSIFAKISWTAPISNRDLDYYAISVDDGLPMQTRDTSILYIISNTDFSLSSGNSRLERIVHVRLRAVDRCGQQGTERNITKQVVASSENEMPSQNGVKKGS